eukprot:g5995.t1
MSEAEERKCAEALNFCQVSKSAVTICLWPSGSGENEVGFVRDWISGTCGAKIIHEHKLYVKPKAGPLIMLTLYDGEPWLETNCWYNEQPLETGKPTGRWPGAKWKHRLCFKEDREMHVFVVDVANAFEDVWSDKYRVRDLLAERTGHFGNSCMHLSDDQKSALTSDGKLLSGMSCNDSYAYHCSRALLNPFAEKYLNEIADVHDIEDPNFMKTYRFDTFLKWLKDRSGYKDWDEGSGKFNPPNF